MTSVYGWNSGELLSAALSDRGAPFATILLTEYSEGVIARRGTCSRSS